MNKKDFFNVLFISLFSRIFYISLSFVSSLSISSYDKSTGLISNSKLNFLLRWDAICFYEIATNGYTSEHLLAFFPLFPYLISFLGKNALMIGVLLSNIFFIFSSQLLFYLSKKRYSNKISYLTLLLFSFSPCSIIYCTLYSESLFTFLFLILFLILEEKNNFIKNKNTFKVKRNNLRLFISLLIGLICLVRSNGILFFIFCVFYLNIFYILIASMPLIFFQAYSFLKMQRSGLFIPYGFIQKNYWDQGFLRFYFDKKNIPNVIVSIPFLGFGLYLIVCYFVTIKGKLGKKEELRDVNNRLLMLIFTIQTVMSLFFIHSQIFFRFVSFNPLVYWSLALMIEEKGFRRMSLVLTSYFSYSIAYAFLFGAYYPPA